MSSVISLTLVHSKNLYVAYHLLLQCPPDNYAIFFRNVIRGKNSWIQKWKYLPFGGIYESLATWQTISNCENNNFTQYFSLITVVKDTASAVHVLIFVLLSFHVSILVHKLVHWLKVKSKWKSILTVGRLKCHFYSEAVLLLQGMT